MSRTSKVFIGVVVLLGIGVLARSLAHWQRPSLAGCLGLLIISGVASRSRVKLPGLTGTMSMNLPFIMVAVATLSDPESLAIGCLSTLTQCLPAAQRKFNSIQALFNVCVMALAVATTRLVFRSALFSASIPSSSLRLAIATAGFFMVNTAPVAIIISLTEKSGVMRTWASMFQLSFPYYVASAGIAGTVLTLDGPIGWWAPLAMFLVMVGVLHSYRRYFSVPSRPIANDASRVDAEAGAGV